MVAWRTCVVRPVHDVKLEAQDGRVGVEEDVHLVRGVLRVLPAVPHAVRVVQLGRGHAIQLEERVRVKNRFESDKREGSQPPGRTGKEFRARTSAALTRELLPHGASIETFDWALHQHQAASHARATRQRSEGGVHRRVWKRSAHIPLCACSWLSLESPIAQRGNPSSEQEPLCQRPSCAH